VEDFRDKEFDFLVHLFCMAFPSLQALISGFTLMTLLVGLIIGLFGYRLLKLTLGLLGFIVGAYLLGYLASAMLPGRQAFVIVAAFVGGLFGALFLVFVYKVGLFILGLLAGGAIGAVVAAPFQDSQALLIVAVFAVGGAVTVILVQKVVLIVATSVVGSWLVMTCIIQWLGLTTDPLGWFTRSDLLNVRNTLSFLTVLAWLTLMGACAVFQFHRRRPAEPN